MDLAVDRDVDQLDTPHHDLAQVDATESGASQVYCPELRTSKVSALEPRATQISTNEVSHAVTLAIGGDSVATCRGLHLVRWRPG